MSEGAVGVAATYRRLLRNGPLSLLLGEFISLGDREMDPRAVRKLADASHLLVDELVGTETAELTARATP